MNKKKIKQILNCLQSTHRRRAGGDNEPRFSRFRDETRADRISLVIALSDEKKKENENKGSRNEEVFWRWRDRGKGLLMLCQREVHRPTFQRK